MLKDGVQVLLSVVGMFSTGQPDRIVESKKEIKETRQKNRERRKKCGQRSEESRM